MQKRIFILTSAITFAISAGAQLWATEPVGSSSGNALKHPGTEHDYPPSLSSGVAGQREHEKKQKYTCPMHPDVVANHPGNCPKCGMKLMPMEEKKTHSSDNREQALNVQRSTPNHHSHLSHQSHQLNGHDAHAIFHRPCRPYESRRVWN
jgi:hypothetical protein